MTNKYIFYLFITAILSSLPGNLERSENSHTIFVLNGKIKTGLISKDVQCLSYYALWLAVRGKITRKIN